MACRENVDQEIALEELLFRLVSPRMVFDHLVHSARITAFLDELSELSAEESGWETYPEDFFDDEGWNNP